MITHTAEEDCSDNRMSAPESQILWVNHASYVLSHGEVRLITDPWLDGLAFNRGWSLLAPTQFRIEDFADITHIWISHEHPDHFSPPSLLRIPEAIRKRITVLFRRTRDGRVARFCREAGFQVRELIHGQRLELAPSFTLVCGTQGSDSWLGATCGPWSVLNMNDCIFRSDDELNSVKRLTGTPDVLLTQFSYANWTGNPDDPVSMQAAAQEKLREFSAQIVSLAPRWVIPFASFVWFAHEDNVHLNEHANRIENMIAKVGEHDAVPVVLYPGDEWVIGTEHDPTRAAARYAADRTLAENRPAVSSKPATIDQLVAASGDFVARLRSRNWLWVLRPLQWMGTLRPMRVYVRDLDLTTLLPVFGQLSVVGTGRQDAELELSSDSLMFMLKNDYGIDTLLINGKFRELAPGSRLALSKLFAVARQNNDGHYYPARLFDLTYLRNRLLRGRSLGSAAQ